MAQNADQRKASDRVAQWLASRQLDGSWLAANAQIDPGTVADFLAGARWPKLSTQGKIESALGWPAGCIRQIGMGAEADDVIPSDPALAGRRASTSASATGSLSLSGSGSLGVDGDPLALMTDQIDTLARRVELLVRRIHVLEHRLNDLEADSYQDRAPTGRRAFGASERGEFESGSVLADNYAPAAKHGVIEESGEFNT